MIPKELKAGDKAFIVVGLNVYEGDIKESKDNQNILAFFTESYDDITVGQFHYGYCRPIRKDFVVTRSGLEIDSFDKSILLFAYKEYADEEVIRRKQFIEEKYSNKKSILIEMFNHSKLVKSSVSEKIEIDILASKIKELFGVDVS